MAIGLFGKVCYNTNRMRLTKSIVYAKKGGQMRRIGRYGEGSLTLAIAYVR
jgi:hypothetical protein